FGVTIPDARAEHLRTFGDLYAYLLERTQWKEPTPCPTSRAFYRLRRTLTGELGVERARVRPAALLRDLFPADSRGATWPRLAAALGLPGLPDPDPPPRGPSRRAFGITLAATTAGVWLVYLLLFLLPGDAVPVAVGFLLWFLYALLVCLLFGA